MAEGNGSQELAIPDKGKKGFLPTVQKILRRPADQAIKQTPIGQTEIEMSKGEMSVERAREILEYLVNIPESGLDAHERHLTPQEQLKRFGGIHYEDIKKAFGVYANHLVTTHGAKKPQEYYEYRLLKEDFLGPDHHGRFSEVHEARYYDLELSIPLDFYRPKVPKAVRLTLHDGKRHGMVYPHARGVIRVESGIPLVNVKPDSSDEKSARFYDNLSAPDPDDRASMRGSPKNANLRGLRLEANQDYESGRYRFHIKYKDLHRGMRWAAANLLHWDENKIIYPDDLDKSPSPLGRGQPQLSKPKLELPPKP